MVAPLLAKLNDKDEKIGVFAAAALHALDEPSHLARFFDSANVEVRLTAVRAYARPRDDMDRRLLSRDLDTARPWLDPQSPITDTRVGAASSSLGITSEQVRSRYERMAVDLKLKLSWKS